MSWCGMTVWYISSWVGAGGGFFCLFLFDLAVTRKSCGGRWLIRLGTRRKHDPPDPDRTRPDSFVQVRGNLQKVRPLNFLHLSVGLAEPVTSAATPTATATAQELERHRCVTVTNRVRLGDAFGN